MTHDATVLSHEAIANAVEGLETKLVQMLVEMVSIDSQVGTPGLEEMQSYMATVFEGMGLEIRRFPVDISKIQGSEGFSPSWNSTIPKTTVVATHTPVDGRDKGKSIIFNGHVDVVPEGPDDLWTTSPFSATVRDGRVFGRGSGDMKGGIVAMIVAFQALKNLGHAPASTVHFQSVVDEECTGHGALSCFAEGITADACIIPEPFPFLMTAQLGVMWITVVVEGKPAHVLNTAAGSNAIENAVLLWQSLKPLEEAMNEEPRPPQYKDSVHPINFNLGKIQGGDWGSTVPSRCEMLIRVGFFPTHTAESVTKRVEATLDAAAKEKGIQYSLKYQGFRAEGCEIDERCELMQSLAKAHEQAHGSRPNFSPVTCTTDARFFQRHNNIPATCYGPEYTRNIHGIDESVSIESIKKVATTLAIFMRDWCQVNPIV